MDIATRSQALPAGRGLLHFMIQTQSLGLQNPIPVIHMEQLFPRRSGWGFFSRNISSPSWWAPAALSKGYLTTFGGFGSLKKALWRRDSGDFDPSSLCAAVTYVVNKHEGNYTNRNSGNPARREGTANPLCTKKKKIKKNIIPIPLPTPN